MTNHKSDKQEREKLIGNLVLSLAILFALPAQQEAFPQTPAVFKYPQGLISHSEVSHTFSVSRISPSMLSFLLIMFCISTKFWFYVYLFICKNNKLRGIVSKCCPQKARCALTSRYGTSHSMQPREDLPLKGSLPCTLITLWYWS